MTSDDAPPRRPILLGIRRVDELDLDAPLPDSNPDLVARISEEIRAGGPMSFARFMALALDDPSDGYYAGGGSGQGPGRQGDFLTAPEGHPIFGWAIARHVEAVWSALDRPARFVIREHGAGSGALAAGILDGLRRSGSPLLEAVRYQASDIAPARLDATAARLAGAGLDRYLAPPDGRPAPGIVLANELLDALPVHLVEGGADGELLERFVILAEPTPVDAHHPFAFAAAAPSTPVLADRLAAEGITLDPGQRAEICLTLDGWIAAAAAPLLRGELLLIDYGYPATELYAPSRGSTLRAYHRHRVHADPLVAIGRQDLTAHVDLTGVERAAIGAGLTPLGRTTQARFLEQLGAGELLVALQTEPGITIEGYVEARSALMRMLDPRATGAFAVLGFGRGLPHGQPLLGFPPGHDA